MTERLADDRLQFFLRNRDDIKSWAAIEAEVVAARDDLLERTREVIDQRLRSAGDALVERRDDGALKRIMARDSHWPEWRGVTLEWDPKKVDPFGSAVPKIGFFWWTSSSERSPLRGEFVERCQLAGLSSLGYRVPAGNAWPVLRRQDGSRDWWHDPQRWASGLVDGVIDLWAAVAPHADVVFQHARSTSSKVPPASEVEEVDVTSNQEISGA
jgi:hypothetical protein